MPVTSTISARAVGLPPDPTRPSRLRRLASHEWTVASGLAVVIALVMTWPTAAHLGTTIPQDIYDPLLQAWQVAWNGHALLTDPLHVWDANAFFPERDTLAFSDSLLGYAPIAIFGSGPVAALVTYNVLFILCHALAFVGMYALCRQLGSGWAGAAVAGAAFGYAPWRLGHDGHLNILSTGGIALALAMLARGHGITFDGGYRRKRPWWVFGGWLVAAWQLTLGFGLGVPFAYVLAGLVVAGLIRRRLLAADVAGIAAFLVVALCMGLPYLRVVGVFPESRRTLDNVDQFSAPWRGLLAAPEYSSVWSGLLPRGDLGVEQTLFVGFVVIIAALFGLVVSVWTLRVRVLLAVLTVVSVVLSTGVTGKLYVLLYHVLPAWDAMRTPGRLMVWTTLLLGVLASGAITTLRPRRRWLLAVPALLVLLEGSNSTPHPVVPVEPVALHGAPGPIMVLPSDGAADQAAMYWSTDGFPKIVNGGSGIDPKTIESVRGSTVLFPDWASVSRLRQLGVRTVVVRCEPATWRVCEYAGQASIEGLGITRTDVGNAVIFTLPGTP